MKLEYRLSTVDPNRLRTLHIVVVEDEILSTTRADEVLKFVKRRNPTKAEWKEFKNAVRNGEQIKIL